MSHRGPRRQPAPTAGTSAAPSETVLLTPEEVEVHMSKVKAYYEQRIAQLEAELTYYRSADSSHVPSRVTSSRPIHQSSATNAALERDEGTAGVAYDDAPSSSWNTTGLASPRNGGGFFQSILGDLRHQREQRRGLAQTAH